MNLSWALPQRNETRQVQWGRSNNQLQLGRRVVRLREQQIWCMDVYGCIMMYLVEQNDWSISGWWFQPLWKILASWDDSSKYMDKYKMFQTTNQIWNEKNKHMTLILERRTEWNVRSCTDPQEWKKTPYRIENWVCNAQNLVSLLDTFFFPTRLGTG